MGRPPCVTQNACQNKAVFCHSVSAAMNRAAKDQTLIGLPERTFTVSPSPPASL